MKPDAAAELCSCRTTNYITDSIFSSFRAILKGLASYYDINRNITTEIILGQPTEIGSSTRNELNFSVHPAWLAHDGVM
jgi:hypothetical protein